MGEILYSCEKEPPEPLSHKETPANTPPRETPRPGPAAQGRRRLLRWKNGTPGARRRPGAHQDPGSRPGARGERLSKRSWAALSLSLRPCQRLSLKLVGPGVAGTRPHLGPAGDLPSVCLSPSLGKSGCTACPPSPSPSGEQLAPRMLCRPPQLTPNPAPKKTPDP